MHSYKVTDYFWVNRAERAANQNNMSRYSNEGNQYYKFSRATDLDRIVWQRIIHIDDTDLFLSWKDPMSPQLLG